MDEGNEKTTVHIELTHQEIDVLLQSLNDQQSRSGGQGATSTPAEIRAVRDKLNAAIRARPKRA